METSLTPVLKPKNLQDAYYMYYKWYKVLSLIYLFMAYLVTLSLTGMYNVK
jgi:hypothetical protein